MTRAWQYHGNHKYLGNKNRLAPEDAVKITNLGDRALAKDLEIADRVPLTVPRESFVTVKDQKDNFENCPQARLLNPCKPELGRVSKRLLEQIVLDVTEKTGLLQFKNTFAALKWFNEIENKNKSNFLQYLRYS